MVWFFSSQHHHHLRNKHSDKVQLKYMLGTSRPFLCFLCLASVLLFIFCYSAMLSRDKAAAALFTTVSNWQHHRHANGEDAQQGKEEEAARSCDLSRGRWVRDPAPHSYTNQSCPSMPQWKDCRKYGKDMDYVNWRWKPHECDLPRFDAGRFLHVVRGKKMAFVGDSLSKNQFDSLLCLLTSQQGGSSPRPTSEYKDSEDKFQTWYFSSHDFTLVVMLSRFLVQATERMRVVNGSASGSGGFDLHVNRVDPSWAEKLAGIHYLVLSDAHWFFRNNYLYEEGTSSGGNTSLVGCTVCSEPNVTTLGIASAVQRSVRTALKFIHSECRDCEDGLLTVVRTFSPAHFENGAWNTGGYCNRTRPMNLQQQEGNGTDIASFGHQLDNMWEITRAQAEEVATIRSLVSVGGGRYEEAASEEKVSTSRRGRGRYFEVLDVSKAMARRGDGHPGSHWDDRWMKGYNDCLHWCLPGPVDLWNEMLMAIVESKYRTPQIN